MGLLTNHMLLQFDERSLYSPGSVSSETSSVFDDEDEADETETESCNTLEAATQIKFYSERRYIFTQPPSELSVRTQLPP